MSEATSRKTRRSGRLGALACVAAMAVGCSGSSTPAPAPNAPVPRPAGTAGEGGAHGRSAHLCLRRDGPRCRRHRSVERYGGRAHRGREAAARAAADEGRQAADDRAVGIADWRPGRRRIEAAAGRSQRRRHRRRRHRERKAGAASTTAARIRSRSTSRRTESSSTSRTRMPPRCPFWTCASGEVTQRVKVGEEPEGVTVRPDGRVVYVSCEGENEVVAIDTTTYKVVGRLKTAARPRSIVFTPDGATAFIATENGNAVNVVDATKHAVLETLKIPPTEGTPTPPRPMGTMHLARRQQGVRLVRQGEIGRGHRRRDAQGAQDLRERRRAPVGHRHQPGRPQAVHGERAFGGRLDHRRGERVRSRSGSRSAAARGASPSRGRCPRPRSRSRSNEPALLHCVRIDDRSRGVAMTAAALLIVHLALGGPQSPAPVQPSAATATGTTLSGVVRDGSGRAVSGATVILRLASGAERQVVTSADGAFSLPDPSSGAATLIVRAGGFAEARRPIAGSEPTASVDVVLTPAGLAETVTVTATRSEQRTGDLPASVSVLGRQEIRQSPAVVADDVLRQIPTFSLFPPDEQPVVASHGAGRLAARHRAERRQPHARAARRRAVQRSVRRLGLLDARAARERRPDRGRRQLELQPVRQLRDGRRHQPRDGPAGAGARSRCGRSTATATARRSICRPATCGASLA